MKKLLLLIICATAGVVTTSSADATSFEDMSNQVESGHGLIYNPVSEGLMTKENSIEYVEIVKEKLVNNKIEIDDEADKLEEVLEETYLETKKFETNPNTVSLTPSNILRGASLPSANSIIYLDDLPGGHYTSDPFSGAGWRYSGHYFFFRNLAANPYYGVAVSGDSFEFRDAFGGYHAV